MTDEELIKAQAAEIERLMKERDAAVHLARMRKAYIEEARDERDAFEAKLEKAVKALGCWNRMMNNPAYDMGEMVSEFDAIARTTLAELTGAQKDGY